MIADNPILNSSYHEPTHHYDTYSEGSLDYNYICRAEEYLKQIQRYYLPGKPGKKKFLIRMTMQPNI